MSASRTETILRYIGANVRRLRIARGWTQVQLADAAQGVKERFVQLLETGTANPSVRVLITIADALGVAPADLFAPTPLGDRKKGRPPKQKQ